ncbi:hypothetical protein Dfri01_59610 [Dyadobacter frigoris]|uniref:hypothetical protein n=1 Tax=Dyadobacter frigoris TaxID=2576211 RepID=UPI0024A0EED4|nr:hypothetical protein [Dyadobacter frigoris]GLU56500.1 hypothetical protein Dfri01_59610 [Dyadobacter frigoris]
MNEKPSAASFDSLKGGRGASLSDIERQNIESAMHGDQEENGEGFLFDETAKIGGGNTTENVETDLEEPEDLEKKKLITDQSNFNIPEDFNSITSEQDGEKEQEVSDTTEENEEDEEVWNATIHDEYEETSPYQLEETIIGELTSEETILLNSLKIKMIESEEIRIGLVEECIKVNDTVNQLEKDTDNRIETIVSKLLTSRERVIFNLFPQIKYEDAA